MGSQSIRITQKCQHWETVPQRMLLLFGVIHMVTKSTLSSLTLCRS